MAERLIRSSIITGKHITALAKSVGLICQSRASLKPKTKLSLSGHNMSPGAVETSKIKARLPFAAK